MKTVFKNLVFKSLYVIAAARYPKIRADLKYFVRDNYYCKLFQTRFFIKDYLNKKPYKVITYQGEFDQELRYVIPFAYWHFINGTLGKTVSCSYTKELYFFSKNHEEKFEQRIWTETYNHYNVPNMTHSNTYSFKKWLQVPFKQYYKNDKFKFEKPILIIANKYNIEWDQPPINFFDITTLDNIISGYKHKYQIIYNRPLSKQIVLDNSEVLSLNEHNFIRSNHPEVILMDDLFAENQTVINNYNHLQLMVYANCEKFVSIHGGTAVFASYFGGINIILSNPDWGMETLFNEYETLFPKLSGAKVLHAKKVSDVFKFLEHYY
ncbi:MAG: hypothetical protein EOP42_02545 [Sphingobacteriaceae bacterium]|nr:MAG: hypothetical protein EOP42_02545 [Sphingobacteriaceae bacterium]